jgi:hypothetical protein
MIGDMEDHLFVAAAWLALTAPAWVPLVFGGYWIYTRRVSIGFCLALFVAESLALASSAYVVSKYLEAADQLGREMQNQD